jgi:hypothetical protein
MIIYLALLEPSNNTSMYIFYTNMGSRVVYFEGFQQSYNLDYVGLLHKWFSLVSWRKLPQCIMNIG